MGGMVNCQWSIVNRLHLLNIKTLTHCLLLIANCPLPIAHCSFTIDQNHSNIFTSVLLFCAFPAAVLFEAMGTDIPYPLAVTLAGSIPLVSR